jgi:hypothetical protein
MEWLSWVNCHGLCVCPLSIGVMKHDVMNSAIYTLIVVSSVNRVRLGRWAR